MSQKLKQSTEKLKSPFNQGDFVTRTVEWEISAVSRKPPDDLQELALNRWWLTASRNGLDVIPVTLSQTVCHLVGCRVVDPFWSDPGDILSKKSVLSMEREYSAEGHKFFKPSSLIPFSFFHFSFAKDIIITIKCIIPGLAKNSLRTTGSWFTFRRQEHSPY